MSNTDECGCNNTECGRCFPWPNEPKPQPTSIRERIVEVLAKYSVRLEDAPLDALAMAMERMNENRAALLSRWRAVGKALDFGKHNGEIYDYDDEIASELVRLHNETVAATEHPQ